MGAFSHQDVVRSELPGGDDGGGDLGEPVDGDSGRFVERNTRNYFRIAPFFSYDVTQRQRIEFDAHYLQADFDKQLENAQQDFSETAVSAGWGFRYSERSSIAVHARRVAVRNGFRHRRLRRLTCNGTRTSPSNRASTCAPARSRPNRRTAKATPT